MFVILHIAGADQRQDDLFSNENLFSRGKSAFRKGLKGVDNVYTQHTPHLAQTLESLIKGRLKETSYPHLDPSGSQLPRPSEVIIFMIGGITYEEYELVSRLNQSEASQGIKFILGGTALHNSTSSVPCDFLIQLSG